MNINSAGQGVPRDIIFQEDQSTEGNQTRVVATTPFIPTEGATGWSDLSAPADGATARLAKRVKYLDNSELSLTQQQKLLQIEEFYEKTAKEDKTDFYDLPQLLILNFDKIDIIRAKNLLEINSTMILKKLSCETFFLALTNKMFSLTIGNGSQPINFELPKSFLLYGCHPYEIDTNCSYFNKINFISPDGSDRFIKSNAHLSFKLCNFSKAQNTIITAPSADFSGNLDAVFFDTFLVLIVLLLDIHGEFRGVLPYYSSVKKLKLNNNNSFSSSNIDKRYFSSGTLTSLSLIKITVARETCNLAIANTSIKHSKMINLHLDAETVNLNDVTLETLILKTLHLKKLIIDDSSIKTIVGEGDGYIDVVIIKNDPCLTSISNLRAKFVIIKNCYNLTSISIYASILKIIDCPNLQENKIDILTELNGGLSETFLDRSHLLSLYKAGKFGDDMITKFHQKTIQEESLGSDENKMLVKSGNIFILKNLEAIDLSNLSENKLSLFMDTIHIQELLEAIYTFHESFYDILPVDDTTIPEENRECPILQMVPEDPIRHKVEGVSDSIYHIYSFKAFLKLALTQGEDYRIKERYFDAYRNSINFKGLFRVIPQNLYTQ